MDHHFADNLDHGFQAGDWVVLAALFGAVAVVMTAVMCLATSLAVQP